MGQAAVAAGSGTNCSTDGASLLDRRFLHGPGYAKRIAFADPAALNDPPSDYLETYRAKVSRAQTVRCLSAQNLFRSAKLTSSSSGPQQFESPVALLASWNCFRRAGGRIFLPSVVLCVTNRPNLLVVLQNCPRGSWACLQSLRGFRGTSRFCCKLSQQGYNLAVRPRNALACA